MRNFLLLFIALFLSGCASVPKQVVDAMGKQREEIKNVKRIYFENMYNQLSAIEKYELEILDIYEEQYKNSIRKAPGTKKDENGNIVETLVAPTGDDEIDVINVALLDTVENFFNAERDSVRNDIQKRKEEIRKAEQNFENIELINSAVNEYLESLVRLKESRDKLAISIRNKLGTIISIPTSVSNIPDPSTIEDIIKNLKMK